MRSFFAKFARFTLLPYLFFLLPHPLHAAEPKLSPLPEPLSNNAVAIANSQEGVSTRIFSFMGIGAKKTWDAVTTSAYELDLKTGKWEQSRPVPGVTGRLGASAVAFGGQVFVFGGYVPDAQGEDTILGDLNVYVPYQSRYFRGKDMPVPVADAVVASYSDRFIYVIGGRAKNGPVHDVQIYDADNDKWLTGTPIPGTPVFGHAGAILGDTIIYVDGAYRNPDSQGPKYIASSECWMGKIPTGKHADITKIEWTKLPAHPGNGRFRIAAGADPPGRHARRIYFSGGTGNPYNYNGIGYNRQPAEPSAVTFAFDVKSGQWETISENTPEPTMDHRGLLVTPRGLVMVGGMEKSQKVTSKVTIVKPGSRK